MTKVEALKTFFGTPLKPITDRELIDLRRDDPAGYDELAEAAMETLLEEVPQVAATVATVAASAQEVLPVGALV